MITPKQLTQIQTICSKRFPDRSERLEFLSQFVGEPISSAKELTSKQADDIIYHLNTGKTPDNSYYARFDKDNKQHNTILSYAHQFGWKNPEKPWLVDLNRLGAWLISKYSPVRKPMFKMTREECSKVISALENMNQKKWK